MPGELTNEREVFLSTLPAGRGERRRALAAVLVSAAIFLAAAPFAKVPLPPVPAFIPIYQSALVINDLITAVLLFGQFGILRSRALLLLGSAYLFSAFMAESPQDTETQSSGWVFHLLMSLMVCQGLTCISL